VGDDEAVRPRCRFEQLKYPSDLGREYVCHGGSNRRKLWLGPFERTNRLVAFRFAKSGALWIDDDCLLAEMLRDSADLVELSASGSIAIHEAVGPSMAGNVEARIHHQLLPENVASVELFPLRHQRGRQSGIDDAGVAD
jgi:hypothetical protein